MLKYLLLTALVIAVSAKPQRGPFGGHGSFFSWLNSHGHNNGHWGNHGDSHQSSSNLQPQTRPSTFSINGANCGVSSVSRVAPLIVGGTQAVPHSWPWMASLLRYGSHFCGGALINSRSVLTAAHCTSGQNIRNLSVKLGSHNRLNTDDGEQTFSVSRKIQHPSYNSNTLENDVAILRLDREVQESQSILPVCVATALPKAGTNCTTTGWGTLSSGGSLSNVLMQVNVPLVDHNTCDNYYKSYGGIDESTMVCAGYESGGKDSCQGDSGGPLVCKNSDAQWEVVGITSWGVGCAWEKYPGVYAKVSTFQDWIAQNA